MARVLNYVHIFFLKFVICVSLFDEVKVIDVKDDKTKYIIYDSSVFIDDSFAERQNVKNKLGIPVFDLDMVEGLVDWRS